MKKRVFNYKKGNDVKKRELVVLNDSDTHMSGIDLTVLTDEERQEFLDIHAEYEEKTKKFVSKAFRNFIKENVSEYLEE